MYNIYTINNTNQIHKQYKLVVINLLLSQGCNQHIAQYLSEFIMYENSKKQYANCLFELENKIINLKTIDLKVIYKQVINKCIQFS